MKADLPTLAERLPLPDCVSRFSEICWLFLNGNDFKFFLQVYQDAQGNAKFARNKTARADQREEWAWNTITGKAKTPVGIGFYPTNINGESRWGAMDFDAHGEDEKSEAHHRAHAAFDILKRHCQHRLLLGTSGGGGWHLFVISNSFHKIEEWIRFLEEVALRIRVRIAKGVCEIFPSSTRGRHGGGGIRAPGTWNPKNGDFGRLFEDQVSPAIDDLLSLNGRQARALCSREEIVSSLYLETPQQENGQFTDKRQKARFSDASEFASRYAIFSAGTRRTQLKNLIGEKFRSCGHELIRWAAELQYRQATPKPNASLEEHLTEFDQLWIFFCKLWRDELSERERSLLDSLQTQNEHDGFRIIQGFAELSGARPDFPVSCAYLARQIGITYMGVSKMRKKFELLGIIRMTAPHKPNVKAARYQWIADSSKAAAAISGRWVGWAFGTFQV